LLVQPAPAVMVAPGSLITNPPAVREKVTLLTSPVAAAYSRRRLKVSTLAVEP
jgi:hypothetical protein